MFESENQNAQGNPEKIAEQLAQEHFKGKDKRTIPKKPKEAYKEAIKDIKLAEFEPEIVRVFYLPFLLIEKRLYAQRNEKILAEILRGSFAKQRGHLFGPGITHKDIDIIQITVDGIEPARDIFKNPEIPPAITKYDSPNEPFVYECWAYPKSLIRKRLDKIDWLKSRKVTEKEKRELNSYINDQLGYALHNGLLVYKSISIGDERIERQISKLVYIGRGVLVDWKNIINGGLKDCYPEQWQTACHYVKKKNMDVFKRYYK
ncbi:MAG: hypothetical protein QW751_00005 [Candidatus Aenigmatarchaeota archaeon]